MSARALSLNPRLWILGPKRDLSLFVLAPLWIIPLMWLAKTRFDVNVFGAAILAIGGIGHHLPGFIRAYTDPVLFRRFRMRFILAPVLFVTTCLIFSTYHLQSLKLILLLWGVWHGAMQINGFLRIYDSKVGSISPITAWLDWAMCLLWFGGGLLHSSIRLIEVFSYFYGAGGWSISPEAFFLFRQTWDVLIVCTTIAFGINAWRQTRAGIPPNPVKFLLMASSFGFWWFAMTYVGDLLVALVLFEIFHDVQYNALVWVYNQRRVEQGITASPAEKFLFQPVAWRFAFYALLVLGYGYFGMAANYASTQTQNLLHAGTGTVHFWTGLFVASALLHFYFDGFIWRVREGEFRQGLGIEKKTARSVLTSTSVGFPKWLTVSGWKWSLFIIPAFLLGVSEYRGNAIPLVNQYENMVNLIPDSWQVHFVLGLMKKSAGDLDGATDHFEKTVSINPDFEGAQALLGDIYFHSEKLDLALEHYLKAAALDSSDYEVQDHLGTLLLMQGRTFEAVPHLLAAAEHEPNDANLSYLVGTALMQNRKVSEAIPWLQRTLQLDPNFSGAREKLEQAEKLMAAGG